MSDDDIIELTDVVKPGQAAPAAPATGTAAPSAAPEPPASRDFGADLDALLNDFGDASPPAPAADASGSIAAPIANPTESGREVDANEELDLPPLSDLDALLEELGVQDDVALSEPPATASDPSDALDAMPSPVAEAAAPAGVPAPEAPSADTPADPFDDILAAAASSAPADPFEEALAAAPAEPAAFNPDDLFDAPAPAAETAPAPAPEDPFEAALAAEDPFEAAVAAAPAEPAPAPAPADPFEDALADAEPAAAGEPDLAAIAAGLAAAKSGQSAPAEPAAFNPDDLFDAPARAAETAPAPAPEDPFEAAIAAEDPPAQEDIPAVEDVVVDMADTAVPDDVTDGIDMNELDAMLDTVLAAAPKPASRAAPKVEAAPAEPAPVPEIAAPVVPEAVPSTDLDEFLEMSAVAAAAAAAPEDPSSTIAPASAPLIGDAAELAALRAEVASLKAELEDLRANMDKYAAAAAARVIREEIAVLAKHL